jgi:CRP/FNR family cyclic AMP-dependent transcriptional regulator
VTAHSSLLCIPLASIAALTNSSPAAYRKLMNVIIRRLRTAGEILARVQPKNINEVIDEKMTFGEKVADVAARFGGSWTFIVSFCGCLLLWMSVNTAYFFRSPPEPFP